MAEAKSENKKAETREHPVPFWEWIIAAFGLLLVLGAIGTTLYRAAFEESTPPILEFIVDEIQPTAKGYLVRFRVKNTGSQTAAGLAIEGSLRRGEESVLYQSSCFDQPQQERHDVQATDVGRSDIFRVYRSCSNRSRSRCKNIRDGRRPSMSIGCRESRPSLANRAAYTRKPDVRSTFGRVKFAARIRSTKTQSQQTLLP
ncbi:MAG: hypothetical protein LC734_06350 [Acidobacteria bacterium]|nr:hypothetical protein [Acidobacteriota bacterium]